MRLVRNHQIEISGREDRAVLVVELEGLDGADDDFCAAPIPAPLLVDDCAEVRREEGVEHLPRLLFQLQPIHQEEDAPRVAGSQEELDDRRRSERLACAGGHLEQPAVFPLRCRLLQGADCAYLVRTQEAQVVRANVAGALVLVLERSCGGVAGSLGQDDVIAVDLLGCQTMRIWLYLPIAEHRVGRREGCDDVRVAALEVPEVMEIAVREDDEAAILRVCISARLLLADQRVLVLGFRLEHDERESAFVEQQKVDEPPGCLLEVAAEGVQRGFPDGNALFELDVCWLAALWKEAPSGRLQQPVDLHPRCRFVHPAPHIPPSIRRMGNSIAQKGQ